MDTETTVLTVPEAAKLLRLSRSFTYQLIAQGDLPSLRLGRRVLVPRAALEEFVLGGGGTGEENVTSRTA